MRKFKLLMAFTGICCLLWYLFIKPDDYIVRFKTNTSPGTLSLGVEDWSKINQKKDAFTYKINQKTPYTFIDEDIQINEMSLRLNWRFESVNDTVTQVKVGVIENENSFFNRLTVPFFKTKFKQESIGLIQDYKNTIEHQLNEKFKIKYLGIDTIPEITYAYVELVNVDMRNKASKMIDVNAEFIKFLNSNNLKEGELPFLVVNDWDLFENKINFRYCFPIKMKDSMPFHEKVKYDKIESKVALKAIYNGNYATSDRGWLTIHEYAKRHNVDVENRPVEIFKNNPHDGGNELRWVAEVYMPIIN